MTLIAGYIYGGTVNLVADSAQLSLSEISPRLRQNLPQTNTLGERSPVETDEGWIEEGAQKLYVIANQVILTFAGDVREGYNVLEDLSIRLASTGCVGLSEVLESFFHECKPMKAEFLIGFIEQGHPRLYCCSKKQIKLLSENLHGVSGGAGSQLWFIPPIFSRLLELWNAKASPDTVLVVMTSLLQTCTLNDRTFERGVGGFFNGVQVSPDGVKWCPDTEIVLYSSKHFEKIPRIIIDKFNRDGVTALITSAAGNRLFSPSTRLSQISIETFLNKWGKALLTKRFDEERGYFSFICHDRRIVNIVVAGTTQFDQCLEIKISDPSSVEYTPHFIDHLLRFPIHPVTGQEDRFGIMLNLF
ncbi:MAG TPA: hypothetical protein VFE50_23410 [Cyclobacteriaceae bacterium]|nr:hypothetical protein [Cyclobacteriaceae bacterium]